MIYVLILFLFINNVFGIFPIAASYTVPVIILCAWKGFSKPTIYKKIFLLILLGLVLNLCSSQFFRGQSPWDTIRAMPSYFGLLFYFYLKQKSIQLWRMEKILLALIYTLDILYISQYYLYTLYGLNFMHLDDWMLGDSEGGVRLRIVSSSLYLVGLFYGLVNWYVTRERKYLIPFLLGLFIMLLSGYRQFIASFVVVAIYMLWRIDKRFSTKQIVTLVMAGAVFYGALQIPAVQEKIQGMKERSEGNQSLDNEDYVRVVQFEYFEHQFFKSPIERVLGAGIPLASSKYGKDFEQERSRGMQYVDWSFLGVSWMLGTITVIGLILLALKVVFLKVDKRYTFFSLYFIFLLISITNFEFFRDGNFLVHAIMLYMAEQASFQYKNNELKYDKHYNTTLQQS